MPHPSKRRSGALELGLLTLAGGLVPAVRRREWLHEWRGELGYLHAVAGDGIRARTRRLHFVLGAFADARMVHSIEGEQRRHFPRANGSPITCLFVLGLLLASAYGATYLLAGVRAERDLAPTQIGHGLVLIEDAEDQHHGEPTIAPFQIRAWRQGRQRYFDGFAYYYLAAEVLNDPAQSGQPARWRIAHATTNLLPLLEAPVRLEKQSTVSLTPQLTLVLCESGWKRRYGANPHVVGRVVQVNGQPARIVGVAPDGMWRLPGAADAWLIDPATEQARGVRGYAVAHLTAEGQTMMRSPRVDITAYRAHLNTDAYEGVALYRASVGPWSFFLYATFLALATLPVIVPLERSELNLHAHELGWMRRLLRPLFYAAKLALVWPIAYFTSLDVAYGWPQLPVDLQTYLQLATGFLVCLFGVRWAMQDQYHRCPICLRRVAHPARVGFASNNLLAWSGTEMICTGGHTLLHIPGLPMSWFHAPRWQLRRAA